MAEKVYIVNIDKAKLSAHTPRRKLAIALLDYEFGSQPFTLEEAGRELDSQGLTEGDRGLLVELLNTGFLSNPYE